MKISVITPCLNEREQLLETIRAIGRRGVYEIIVVDDASDDQVCCNNLKLLAEKPPPHWPAIRVIRNAKRMGCCPSRNIGGRAAEGDVFVFMDCHMRVSGEGLATLGVEALKRNAIVQACTRRMDLHAYRTLILAGGRWVASATFGFDATWVTGMPTDEVEPREAVLGACYAMPREVFERIGGFMDNTGYWGFTEGVLSLKAWLCGVDIFVHREIHARHWFRRNSDRNYDVANDKYRMSPVAGQRICFTDKTFRERCVPALRNGPDGAPGSLISHYKLEEFVDSPALVAEHEAFQAARDPSRTDEEFFAKFVDDRPTIKKVITVDMTTEPQTPAIDPAKTQGKHIALIRLHDFESHQQLVLDEAAKVVDAILCVANPSTTDAVMAIADAHPAVTGIWRDAQPWDQAGSYERAFAHVKAMGYHPATVYYLDHDELPPAHFLEERQRFMDSDAGRLEFMYVWSWGTPERIVRPDVPVHRGPLAKLVKWHDGLHWTPKYRGCCRPHNSGEAMICAYPMRHLNFMRPEWREAKLSQPRTKAYGETMAWVATPHDEQITVEYDDRPWDRWINPPDLKHNAAHHLKAAGGARSRTRGAAMHTMNHFGDIPEEGIDWFDGGTRDGWLGDYLNGEYGEHVRFTGMEFHPGTARAAQEAGRNVVQGDARDLSAYGDASFHIVSLWHTLEHVPDPQTMADEAWRVLRPGGIISAVVPLQQALGKGHMAYIPSGESLRVLWPEGDVVDANDKGKQSFVIVRKREVDLVDYPNEGGKSGELWPRAKPAPPSTAPPTATPDATLPFVSAVCCTFGRVRLLEEAVKCFLDQDYPGPKELVILNDLDSQTLHFDHPEVTIINLPRRMHTYGEKRNAIMGMANGEILFPWDDDDIHLPWRMRVSVERLGDEDYFKPARAWTWHGGPLEIGTSRYHAMCCIRRDFYYASGGYPPQEQSTDTVLHKRMGAPENGELSDRELYYIYRWGAGADGVPHLSGHQVDAVIKWAHNEAPRGDITLVPLFQHHYRTMVKEALDGLA